MSAIRAINITILAISAILIIAGLRMHNSLVLAGMAGVLIHLSILYYGVVTITAAYFVPALNKADTNEKIVALSFDDGPHPTNTPKILDALKSAYAPASFFVIGKNIAGNEHLLYRAKNEGHLVGNHSFCHDFWFDMYSTRKMLDDMRKGDDAIAGAIGEKPVIFRPPYGITNPNLKRAIKKGKYLTIGWSVRSLDTTTKDKEKLLSRITDRLKPGDIILLHDSMDHTTDMLPEIINAIREKGFTIKGIDEMLNISAYA